MEESINNLIAELLQLGLGGLMFILFFLERKDRLKLEKEKIQLEDLLKDVEAKLNTFTDLANKIFLMVGRVEGAIGFKDNNKA